MKLTIQDKVMLVMTACWLAFFLFIMVTTISDDGTPAKFLFRQILLTFSVPLFALWLTGTLKHVTAWFHNR